ncbi:protein tyrosine phosphate [Klebsormidium nitens]|uniref:Protein tyrosine phosphate n=1 Tax=Klebsormidium nitens TaxID=105231 RepID=A0A1Y1HL53_KLENI|nr:protein tyrosine phosphate [Klebsormidium nitens]|eukprot:GAQ77869.1 protein tyrosine phosphate [Klebsormidium nitens]
MPAPAAEREAPKDTQQALQADATAAAAAAGSKKDDAAKTDEYSKTMQQTMGTALTYRHELGMNFAHVLPDLIVGSCLQKPADVDRLVEEENVGAIICLQQDPDLAYFSLDLGAIQRRCAERKDVEHIRSPIRDFDPFDLRMCLPDAVQTVHEAFERCKGKTVYIHCTAGLGRAPGVALAYMHWLRGFTLAEANARLQEVRPCHPKLESIRAATCDVISGGSKEPVTIVWRSGGVPKTVEVAGLDVGWGGRLQLERKDGRWILERLLPAGRYQYKFIVDGHWTYNPDSPLTRPDNMGNVNNFVQVVGDSTRSEAWLLRERLIKEEPTEEDRQILLEKLFAKDRRRNEPCHVCP